MDLLVTAAESWKLLLIGPMLVALIAFGAVHFLPAQYESVATVVVSEKRSQLLLVPGGIEAIMSSPESGQEDADVPASRRTEHAQFSVSARNAVTGAVQIDVRSSDPQRSQALLSEFVGRLAALVAADKESAAKQIQSRLDAYLRQNELLGKIVGSLTSTVPVITSSDSAQNDSAGLAAVALRLTSAIRDNQIAIEEFNEDLVEARKPPPSATIMPGRRVNRNSISIPILSLTLTLVALIAFVFGREAFRKACGNAEVAAKLARIRGAFRKPRS